MNRQKSLLTSEILCVAVFVLSASAEASPVIVRMSVNSFFGQVGSDGQFVTYLDNGSGPEILCPDAGCDTGIGPALVSLGGGNQVEFWNSSFGVDATHNLISFVPSGVNDVDLGKEFLLGTITYTNGIWFTDPEFAVTFSASSTDLGFVQSWSSTVHLSITPNLPHQHAGAECRPHLPDRAAKHGECSSLRTWCNPVGKHSVRQGLRENQFAGPHTICRRHRRRIS